MQRLRISPSLRWTAVHPALTVALLLLAGAARAQAGAPSAADSLRLTLNLPAYRLTVRMGDSVVAEYPVAIGARAFPTPLGSYQIAAVELNPAWVPPESDWARDREPMPPGPRNPMGRAKLEFRPTYFLHGTPEPQSVGSPASHGCVRMRNPDVLDLARRVLAWGRPDVADSTAARWLADTRTRRKLPLDRAVAIDVQYDLLEIRNDRIHIYPDPYRLRSDSTDLVAQDRLAAGFAPRRVAPGTAARLLDLAAPGAIVIERETRPAEDGNGNGKTR